MPEKYIDIEGQRFRVGNGVKNSSSSILKNAARLVAVTAIATGCAGSILPIPTEGAGPIATPISRDAEPSPTSSPTLTPETEVTARPTETVIPTVVPEATATAVPINPEYRLDGPEGFGGVDINGEFLSEEQRVEANKQWEPYIPYIEKMIEAGHYSGFVGVDNPTGISAAVRVLDDERVVVYPKVVGGEKDGTIILPMGAYFDMKGIKVPEMTDGWDSRNVTELSKGTGERAYYESDFLTVVRADSEGNVFETWNHSEGRWVEVRSGLFQLTENDFREMREAVERDATGVTAELHKQYGLVEIAEKRLEIPSESRNVDINFYGSEALIRAMATNGFLDRGYRGGNVVEYLRAFLDANGSNEVFTRLLTPFDEVNNQNTGQISGEIMKSVVAREVNYGPDGSVTVGSTEMYELPSDYSVDFIFLPHNSFEALLPDDKRIPDDDIFTSLEEGAYVEAALRFGDRAISPIVKNRVRTGLFIRDEFGNAVSTTSGSENPNFVTGRTWSFYDKGQNRLIVVYSFVEQDAINPEYNQTTVYKLSYPLLSLGYVANMPALAARVGILSTESNWLNSLEGGEAFSHAFSEVNPDQYGLLIGAINNTIVETLGSQDNLTRNEFTAP